MLIWQRIAGGFTCATTSMRGCGRTGLSRHQPRQRPGNDLSRQGRRCRFGESEQTGEGTHPSWLLGSCLTPDYWRLVAGPRPGGELSEFVRWPAQVHTPRWHAHRRGAGSGFVYPGRIRLCRCLRRGPCDSTTMNCSDCGCLASIRRCGWKVPGPAPVRALSSRALALKGGYEQPRSPRPTWRTKRPRAY